MMDVPTSSCGQECLVSHRQHSGHVLYQQTGRGSLSPSIPMSIGSLAVGILHSLFSSSQGLLPAKSADWAGGLPQQVFLRSSRVVSWTGFSEEHFPEVGVSPGRPVRDRKCHQLCSLKDHSLGLLTDIFLLPWKGHLYYAFPPISLIHKVLLQIK